MSKYFTHKKSNCKNCYKCIRHCPVKAVGFSKNQAYILPNECVVCGECFVTCPQNTITVRDDTDEAERILASGETTFASVAPSFATAFPDVSFNSLRSALKQLGFADAEETAVGAVNVKNYYERLINEEKQKIIISSACHSINMLVRKYYPDAIPYLANVVSPAIAHGLSIKKTNPNSKVIFIGPCISRKAEADEYPGAVDCVLLYSDILNMLEKRNIELTKDSQNKEKDGRTRSFPVRGGVLKSLNIKEHSPYALLSVDGLENCMIALEEVIKGNIGNCLIEMSACKGSCIAGPDIGRKKSTIVKDRIFIRNSAGLDDFHTEPLDEKQLEREFTPLKLREVTVGNAAISEVLKSMGKTLPIHELNCGSCGYGTCREKAHAVLTGKAETSMCLPYLMLRAESFSDKIIGSSPNGIIVLNREMLIQQINATACRIFNVENEKMILGLTVDCILDSDLFAQVISKESTVDDRQLYLAEYDKYIRISIVVDDSYDIVIAFVRDITKELTERSKKDEMNQKALDITDKVIEKQMRTVQEIASLLGETTAETKIALERLKETLQ